MAGIVPRGAEDGRLKFVGELLKAVRRSCFRSCRDQGHQRGECWVREVFPVCEFSYIRVILAVLLGPPAACLRSTFVETIPRRDVNPAHIFSVMTSVLTTRLPSTMDVVLDFCWHWKPTGDCRPITRLRGC